MRAFRMHWLFKQSFLLNSKMKISCTSFSCWNHLGARNITVLEHKSYNKITNFQQYDVKESFPSNP